MDILVTINHFNWPGGSQTFTYDFVQELARLGHRVDIYVHQKISKRMMVNETDKLSIKVYNEMPKKSYDVMIISHTSCADDLKNFKCKKIQICHGIYPALEQPSPNVDKYVAISQEVYEYLANKGVESKIIHNAVNCDRFKPINPINEKLTTVLSLIQGKEANNMAKEVCKELGVNFIAFHKIDKATFHIENEINKADLVITLGRGAIESMACGRNVLIFDKRSYASSKALGDGLIKSEKDALNFIQNNLSGRYSKKVFDSEELKNEIKKYNRMYGDICRNIAVKYFNIENIVVEYLDYVLN